MRQRLEHVLTVRQVNWPFPEKMSSGPWLSLLTMLQAFNSSLSYGKWDLNGPMLFFFQVLCGLETVLVWPNKAESQSKKTIDSIPKKRRKGGKPWGPAQV